MALTTRSNGENIDASWFNSIHDAIENNILSVTEVSTTYPIVASDDLIIADATSGAFVISLPTIVGNEGKNYALKKIDSSANAVTVDADGSETIDGSANVILTTQYNFTWLVAGPNEWHIVSTDDAAALSAHISDTTTHGTTGDIVGTSDSQVLTTKTIDADLNTISNLAHGAEVDEPTAAHGVGEIVGTSEAQTLTTKTIDADNNTISNLAHGAEVDNPTSGVHGATGTIVGTSDTQTLSAKTFSDAITNAHIATPSNPASGYMKIYPKLDNKYYTLDSTGTETEVGSGSGGGGSKNYVDNNDAELDLSGWWEVDDGSVNVPNNSGTPTQSYSFLTRITSGQLSGLASFRFTKPASDSQGISIFYPFTMDKEDFKSQIRCFMKFVDSANMADGDFRFYLAHSSDAFASDFTTVELNPRDIAAGTGEYQGYGQAHYANTSYRFYVTCVDSSTTTYTLDFDRVEVGPGSACVAGKDIYLEVSANSGGATGGITFPYGNIIRQNGISFNDSTYIATIEEAGDYLITATCGSYSHTAGTVDISLYDDTSGSMALANHLFRGDISTNQVVRTSSIIKSYEKGDSFYIYYYAGGGTFTIDSITYNRLSVAKVGASTGASGDSNVVLAIGQANTQSITASTNQLLDFDITEEDNTNSVSSFGGGTLFTAPRTDIYNVEVTLAWSGDTYAPGDQTTVFIQKNDVNYAQSLMEVASADAVTYQPQNQCAITLPLNKGDKITFRARQTSASAKSTNTNPIKTRYSIHSVGGGGSNCVAGWSTIAAKYDTSAGQSLTTATSEIIDFGDVIYDTHNAVTPGGSWKFTAPEYGFYKVSSYVELNFSTAWTAGETLTISVYKNGAEESRICRDAAEASGVNEPKTGGGSVDIELSKGDYINVVVVQNSGSSIALETNPIRNWISISKI
jgi:hypothetical protein